MAPTASVRVDLDARGTWHVVPSTDEQELATCATLVEARDLAYLWAGDHRPCELIVRDAYHRVARHEVVDGPRRDD
jgi:hypothetical protein